MRLKRIFTCAAMTAMAFLAMPTVAQYADVVQELGTTKMVITAEIAEPSYKEYGDTVFLYRIYGSGTDNKGQERFCTVTIPAGETTGSSVVTDLDYMVVKYSSTDDAAAVKEAQDDAKARYKWSIGRIPVARYKLVTQNGGTVSTSGTVSILPEKKDLSTKANPYEQNGIYIYASDGDGQAIAGKRFQIKNAAGKYVTATKQKDGSYLYADLSDQPQTYETDDAGRVTIFKDVKAHALPADTYTIYAVDKDGQEINKTAASRTAATTGSMISYSAVFDSSKSGYKVTTSTYMIANYKYLNKDFERTSHNVLKINNIGNKTASGAESSETVKKVAFITNRGSFMSGSNVNLVEYHSNDGIFQSSETYQEPVYPGHVFAGWAFTPDSDTISIGRVQKEVLVYLGHLPSDQRDVSLYAQWAK